MANYMIGLGILFTIAEDWNNTVEINLVLQLIPKWIWSSQFYRQNSEETLLDIQLRSQQW